MIEPAIGYVRNRDTVDGVLEIGGPHAQRIDRERDAGRVTVVSRDQRDGSRDLAQSRHGNDVRCKRHPGRRDREHGVGCHLAGALCLVASSSGYAATSERLGIGGWIQDFQPELDRANASGELFRVKGHRQSNCTLFLGLRNVRVERSAQLLFHSGHDRQRRINASSTQRMLSAYNPKLRQYVMDHYYMDALAFHTISGADIIDKFGYRECSRR